MNKKLLLIPLLVLLLLMCGCDNRKCLKSHQEEVEDTCVFYTSISTGKTFIMIPHYYSCTNTKTICDEYEEV